MWVDTLMLQRPDALEANNTHTHQDGVHGQFLIQKHCYWLKHVLGDYIDAYMMTKPLGATETFVQELGELRIFVHCTGNVDYITKIMPAHGVLEQIKDHPTWRLTNWEWKTFKYAKSFSHHNHVKHLVNYVNKSCHDPIGLKEVWQTKWWPNQKITFMLSMVEVNCVQAWVCTIKENLEPTLTFCKKLTMRLLSNKIEPNGIDSSISSVQSEMLTLRTRA